MSTERQVRDIARDHLKNLIVHIIDAVGAPSFPTVSTSVVVDGVTASLDLRRDTPTSIPVVGEIPMRAIVVPAGTPKLGRIHRKILEKTSPTEAMPAKKLLSLAGYKDNSYGWEAITFLARARLIVRTPDGYLRAS